MRQKLPDWKLASVPELGYLIPFLEELGSPDVDEMKQKLSAAWAAPDSDRLVQLSFRMLASGHIDVALSHVKSLRTTDEKAALTLELLIASLIPARG